MQQFRGMTKRFGARWRSMTFCPASRKLRTGQDSDQKRSGLSVCPKRLEHDGRTDGVRVPPVLACPRNLLRASRLSAANRSR